jgi:uncharacterized protein
MKKTPSDIIIAIITIYGAVVSPIFPARCRYYPTCSAYAIESVRKYGVLQGLLKAFLRILRCHPFHPGGYDPVL